MGPTRDSQRPLRTNSRKQKGRSLMSTHDSDGTTQQLITGQDGVNVASGVAEAVAEFRASMTDAARDGALSTLETDPDNVNAPLALATHYHLVGVEVGAPDYLSIRDNEGDDGTYLLRDYLVVDGELRARARQEALAQLPLATEAIVHAAKAVELDLDRRECMFVLKRCLEGIVDAAGTILALAESDELKSPCAVDVVAAGSRR